MTGPGPARTAAWMVLSVVLAVPSAIAAVLIHQQWWGLVLGLAAGMSAAAWLPAGWPRVLFALTWCAVVARAVLTRPEGDYLVPADGAGWTLILASGALLVVSLATVPPRRRRREDPEVLGLPT